MTRHVSIILPARSLFPVGGYKVAYEYANQLASHGWRVSVVHPLCSEPASSLGVRLSRRWDAFRFARRPDVWVPWFKFAPGVEYVCLPHPRGTLPKADITIATSWETAEWVSETPENHRGKGFYLIQHFEDWSGERERVLATWKLPLRKLVIAQWLADIAKSLGEDCVHIPNGFDHQAFGVDVPPEMRESARVAMLWHELEWKGSKIGLDAFERVHRIHPELKVELFSAYAEPQGLPDWIAFHRTPPAKELRAMYNRASIFLAPSFAEGFPLPPAEAMMCGAALIATDIGGHHEYCRHGENCRMFPVGDSQAAADEICRLLENKDERLQLAAAGVAKLDEFTWERSTDLLEACLKA